MLNYVTVSFHCVYGTCNLLVYIIIFVQRFRLSDFTQVHV